ncbi:MAG: putative addiction module antidote protein [Bifidobacteriaceae bacterium]|jgi:probable addiction module antidote protein|nr:putative addiction module antidote protein [Bifidobacteriaceae bacterium]MCI1915150.1 putative addiction module antidote protein [Bifidobacteriaceae bacterium]
MPPTAHEWRVEDYLKDPDEQLMYLQEMSKSGDPVMIQTALGNIARARASGMTDISKKAGVGRESLYKSLSSSGNPSFATVLRVAQALGFEFTAKRKAAR